MTTVPATPESLLAERDFVRGLVRSLLRGQDGEDDIVQRLWLRARTSPPRDAGRTRQWLGRVSRNLVTDERRQARHRRQRDLAATRPERIPSTAEVLELEAERRRVVDAVLGLAEPNRAVVLMGYWRTLRPAEIAAELGLPAATIRSHLHRRLAMLRTRLNADPEAPWPGPIAPIEAGIANSEDGGAVGPDGCFELRGLSPDKYTVWFSRLDGSIGRSRPVVVGETDIDGFVFRAREGDASLHVEVRGLAEGWVRIESVRDGSARVLAIAGGDALFHGLEEGKYRAKPHGDRGGGVAREIDVRGAAQVVVEIE